MNDGLMEQLTWCGFVSSGTGTDTCTSSPWSLKVYCAAIAEQLQKTHLMCVRSKAASLHAMVNHRPCFCVLRRLSLKPRGLRSCCLRGSQ